MCSHGISSRTEEFNIYTQVLNQNISLCITLPISATMRTGFVIISAIAVATVNAAAIPALGTETTVRNYSDRR